MLTKQGVQPKILIVGSMNMDLNVYGVDRIAQYGESIFADNYRYSAGGKGANQAFATASLGAQTSIVGSLGQDQYAEAILATLNERSVQTDYVAQSHEFQTGLATIIVNPDGRYFSYVALGANMHLGMAQILPALRSFQPDMVMAQLEMPLETVYGLHRETQQLKIPLFLDAGPAQPLELDRLKNIFLISPNESETVALTGIDPDNETRARQAAEFLYRQTAARHIVLKLGKRGALVYDPQTGGTVIPTFPIAAIDSTAAGDTFNAALGVQLCHGRDILEAVNYANAAATLCVSRKGAMESIPTRQEVEAFLQKHATANQ